mgnify:CR=1 FL=1
MAVIKGDGSAAAAPLDRERGTAVRPQRAGGVVNAEVYDAKQQAQAIIDEAQKKAASLVHAGQAERERIREEARNQGYQEGLAQVSEHILRAKLQAKEVVAAAQQDLMLAAKVAEKIIGHDIERDPAVVVDICATAVEQLRQVRHMVLRVNPSDAAVLRTNTKRFMEALGRSVEVSIKEDNEVESGGCVGQTEFGTLDAQLKTQFEMLRNLLLEETNRKDGPR